MAIGYFNPQKGETPASVEQYRKLAEALMRGGSPQNIGQGISSIGDGIVANVLGRRADKAEAAGMESWESDWGPIMASLGGGGFPEAPAAPGGGAPSSGGQANPIDMSGNQVFSTFMDTVKQGGVNNPYALAAIAATGKHESGFSPENATRTWSDPSESGQPGTAGGIMSWRGPRYQALASRGDLSPDAQAQYFLQEDPNLIAALNNAGSVEEAQALMNNAWKFAGYNREGGEAARRLQTARSLLPTFQGGQAPAVAANEAMATGQPIQIASAGPPDEAYFGPQAAIPRAGGSTDTMTPQQAQTVAAASQGKPAPDMSGVDPQSLALDPETMRQSQPGGNRILETLLSQQPIAEQAGPMTMGAPESQQPIQLPQQTAQAAPEQVIPPMAGGPAPERQGPSLEQLLGAAQNPFAPPAAQGVLKLLIEQEMQKNDPMRQLEMDNLRGQIGERDRRYDFDREKFDFEREDAARTGNIKEFEYGRDDPDFYGHLERMNRAKAANVDARNMGSIPPGYRVQYDEAGNPVQMEPIEGGPAALDAAEEARKRAAGSEVTLRTAQTVYEDTERALDVLNRAGNWAAGAGSYLSALPGTDARALKKHVDSIKGNVGIDSLLKIKESGAGLGQIPQTQLEMLASLLGNLDTAQTPEDLRFNLARIQEIYSDIVQKEGGDPKEMYQQRLERLGSPSQQGGGVPQGVEPELWELMTPEERALFQ